MRPPRSFTVESFLRDLKVPSQRSSWKGVTSQMSTTRTRLQELGLDELRSMAGQVEVDPEGLQKSKLIAAILDSEKFDAAMVPETTEVADGDGKPTIIASDGDRSDGAGEGGDQRQGQDGSRKRRRRRGRGQQEPIDESQLEVREGILDILPEGYGFLRCTGYLPGDKDAYVSANLVRRERLRKGDIVSGPVRPARARVRNARKRVTRSRWRRSAGR